VYLLVSEQYIDSIMHGARIKGVQIIILIRKYIQSQSVFLKTNREIVVSKINFSYHKILNKLCTFKDRNYE